MNPLLTAGGEELKNGFAYQANGGLLRVETVLRGVSPLLMNAMSIDTLMDIRDKKKKPKTTSRPKPAEEAESKLHLLPDGRPHIPFNALYGACVNAGSFVRLDGKRQVSNAQSTTLAGFFWIEDGTLPLFKPDTDTPAAWEVDIRQGRNPNGGEAVCLVRPRFDEWEIRPTFQVDLNQFSIESARQLIELAGSRIGLLDYRPQRRGFCGRYAIVRWQEIR